MKNYESADVLIDLFVMIGGMAVVILGFSWVVAAVMGAFNGY